MKCIICGKEIKSGCALSKHIHSKHDMLSKEYYDKYLKQPNEGICLTCGKPTNFLCFSKGYQKHCNAKCAQKDLNVNNTFRNNNPQKDSAIREKTKQTCLKKYGAEYSLGSKIVREKSKQTLLEKYGVENIYQLKEIQDKARTNSHNKSSTNKRNASRKECIRKLAKEIDAIYVHDLLEQTKSSGWLQSGIVDIIKYQNFLFVKNSDIQKVLDYDATAYKTYSMSEKKIVDTIKQNYSGIIIENSKKIIKPLELDIYLPELNLAVEFNGTYYHSELANCSKDYHLRKSLLCRDKNIRLIHIYEFENLDEQIRLLVSLIKGKDLYNKNDFNKNNLIDIIPKPEIIYDNGRLIVYGAGFLK